MRGSGDDPIHIQHCVFVNWDCMECEFMNYPIEHLPNGDFRVIYHNK